MSDDTARQAGLERTHARFQTWFAWTFLVAAAIVALWMFYGPQPSDPLARTVTLFFVEMPLFVILALVGMNALVRKAMGRRPKRRSS